MQLALADIHVDVDGIDDPHFFGDYLVPSPAPVADLSLHVTPELVQAEREIASQPYFSDAYLAQLALLRQLAEKGPAIGRFLMHAAVLEYDGRAYAFTAPSGTGKSTHLRLWHRTLGNAVQAVNGDKPLLFANETEVVACGTPWSGKEGWQRNVCIPLGGLCFISRGEKDVCRRVEPTDVLERALKQIYVPSDTSAVALTLEFLDVLLRRVPVYELECTMEPTAVRASFEAMTGQDFDAYSINNYEKGTHMRIKQGFVMRDVAGQAVVIATGDASKSFHGMVKLNQTAADVWRGVEEGLDAAGIAKRLVAEYDVEVDRALADVETLLARMREQGFLED